MERISNYIAGKWDNTSTNTYLPVVDPAIGEPYAELPNSDEVAIEKAVKAAAEAFPAWARLLPEERGKILLCIAQGIEAQLDALALAESIDNGKPVHLAKRIDIPRAAKNFFFYGTAAIHFASQSHITSQAINYTLRHPLGVVGCISPWNLPLYLFTWKIAPALAAGNCVVAKPSEITPMTAHLLTKICQEAGLPAGVLNVVHGEGKQAGQALVAHPAVKAISFTGGTQTGATIAKIAAPRFKKLSLELGGKNPTIIFADSDYEKALATSVRAAFTNQGEICLCGSRIFIERSVYTTFKKDFVKAVKELVVGDPLETTTDIGAIVSEAHFQKVLGYIQLAKEEGGTVLTGGEALSLSGRCATGYFIAPTVTEGLPFDCRTNQEEIFGPVVTLMPFDTEEEVLHYANSTRYGLATSLWTQDISRAHRMAAQIEAGIVWINCWMLRDLRTPFGGMKDSGVGREGGFEALDFFTEKKNVCIQ